MSSASLDGQRLDLPRGLAKALDSGPVAAGDRGETTAKDVDRYLAEVPPEARKALEQLRKDIGAAAPQATEHITYGMPTFKLDGRFLVSYAAWKKHCSLYPVSASSLEAMGEDPAKFDVNDKGTLRFPPDQPLSAALVRKLVKARLADLAAGR